MAPPVPVRWLNYLADVRGALPVGAPLGPNLHGEVLYVVSVDYTPGVGSRVGLSFIRPREAVEAAP